MKNKHLLILALATIAAGCTKKNPETPNGNNPKEVAVSFTASIDAPTRTTGGGNSWSAGDRVGIFMLSPGGSPTVAGDVLADNRQYNVSDAATGTLSPNGGGIIYPASGSVDFVAYYPWRTPPAADPYYLYGVSVADQSDPAAIDLLYARIGGESSKETPVSLSFRHAMGRVTFDISLGAGLEALSAGDITAVTLNGMPLTGVMTLRDGSVAPGVAGEFATRKTTANSGADATFTAILVPHTADGYTGRTAAFTVDGAEYPWNIPDTEAFAAGRHLAYPVTIDQTGVTVGAPAIVDWERDDNGDGLTDIVSVIGLATFADGSTDDAYGRPAAGGVTEIVFDGTGEKLIHSIVLDEFDGLTYLIGRRDDETIKLKLDPGTGDVLFRDADSGGNIPVGTHAEFTKIGIDGLAGNYVQEADIDLLGGVPTPYNLTPTGTLDTPFTGSYDGAGYTLANLFIDAADIEYVGLFGAVDTGGSLSGIRIISGSVRGKNRTGGVCGYSRGTVTACYNNASVSGAWEVGGVCGYNSEGTLAMCDNSGAITGTAERIGGVCGWNNWDGTILECRNLGPVTGGVEDTGGVCGSLTRGTMVACYNRGTVTGGENVGGLSGQNHYGTSVTACYSTGVVTGSNAGSTGGFSGLNAGTITACYLLQQDGLNGVGNEPANAQVFAFASGVWPADTGNWEVRDNNAPAGHWGSLGGWNGGNPVYPRLHWEQ